MDYLLEFEHHLQSDVTFGGGDDAVSFSRKLDCDCLENELWSRATLSYAISLKLGGLNSAVQQWASARYWWLCEFTPTATWHLPQVKLEELWNKLSLRAHSCHCVQYSNDITSLKLFCNALICSAHTDREMLNEVTLPEGVTWSDLMYSTYSPIWNKEIDFVCGMISGTEAILHLLATINVIYKCFLNMSAAGSKASSELSWIQQQTQHINTVISHCEDSLLSYCVDVFQQHLCDELIKLSSTKTISSVQHEAASCKYGAKVLLKSCWRLCNDIDNLMCIVNGEWPPSEHLRGLCTDAISRAVTIGHHHLSSCSSRGASQRLPYKSWYILLSSLSCVGGRIRHHIIHSSARFLNTALQRYSQLVDRLQSDIVNYHVELCRTGLLHDARSNHWKDSRPFFEGQRCSFAVQMWAYHLGALQYDLWQVFSNDVAAKLFGGVLVEGLVTLSKRYNGVKPSKRRLPQMKADVVMVLLTTASFLPHLTPALCPRDHPLYVTACVVNDCCMSLLHDVTVVGADLTCVADHLTSSKVASTTSPGSYQWLCCVADLIPQPFTYLLTSSNELADNLLHLCGKSSMDEQLLVKVLVMDDFVLSKGLVRAGAETVSRLANVLSYCSHTPNGLCTLWEQVGSQDCIDWLTSYLQPHLLWCLLPTAVSFTRWMAKFVYDGTDLPDNSNRRKTLVKLLIGVTEKIQQLLVMLPSPLYQLLSRLSPVSSLLGRLLRLMVPKTHDHLFYYFTDVMAGLLDSSLLFDDKIPVQVTNLLTSCKQELAEAVTSLGQLDTQNNAPTSCEDSEHAIIASVIMESVQGKACLHFLYDIINHNKDALLQWCRQGGVAGDLSAPPSQKIAIPFCPTKQVNRVGQVILDHMQLLKVPLDWPALLAQLPKGTLISHLGNRWEFQEEAWLDADESSLLSIIKSKITI